LELLMADLAAMVRDAGDAYGDGSEGSTPIELRRDSMARFETSLQTADDTVRLLPDPTGLKGLKGLKAAPPTRSAYMKRAIYIEPDGGEPPTVAYVRKVRVNPVGATLFGTFVLAAMFYGYVRVAFSLRDLGSVLPFGVVVLALEALGALSMASYGVWLVARTDNSDVAASVRPLRREYTVRVLIPCYRESLAIVRRTIAAARAARRPLGTTVYVYLCDDGCDREKRKYVQSLGAEDVVYVTGRVRDGRATNGKSENLNYALRMIYPLRGGGADGENVSLDELVCLFDADQTCSAEFFDVMLRYVDSGDDVGAALSPQLMHNVLPDCDVFNHQNVHFWESMQPGMDALGFISLTGTNMVLRARALQDAGWFPTETVTEDWTLGMRLAALGWRCRYVQQYLAIGEAPLSVREAFQQRSRWCKGHFQTFWSRECPLLRGGLSPFQRVMYSSTCLSYLSAGLAAPAMTLVPVVTLLFGYFPMAMGVWTVAGITAYYVSMHALTYCCASRKHAVALWLANAGTSILFWPYLKAALTSPYKALAGRGLAFKATAKGSRLAAAATFRELWPSAALVLLSLVAFVAGLVTFDIRVNAPKALALCWLVYNALPHVLLLMYAAVGGGVALTRACRGAMVVSTCAGALAIVLLWLLYPREVDYGVAADMSLEFLRAERAGSGVPRLSGGFFEDGVVGDVRVTATIAETTSLLAWSVLDLDDHWRARPVERAAALDLVRTGADYILQCVSDPTRFVVAAGDVAGQAATWARGAPGSSGPVLTAVLAADVAGQAAAALAAAALVFPDYAGEYFAAAAAAFKRGTRAPASTWPIAPGAAALGARLPSTSGSDDLFWAATWLYRAAPSGAETTRYYGAMSDTMDAAFAERDSMAASRDYFANAAAVHAATRSADYKFHAAAQSFLWDWACSGDVKFTTLGRAFYYLSPTLGDTVEAAGLAAMYARGAAYAPRAFTDGMYCFAESQGRYVLGATTPMSRLTGFGRGPTRTWSRAATCPPWPAPCPDARSSDAPDAYPVRGALLWAPEFTDSVPDARGGNATAVSLDNNRAAPLLFAALALKGTAYTSCLQGVGGLLRSPTCRRRRANAARMGPTDTEIAAALGRRAG